MQHVFCAVQNFQVLSIAWEVLLRIISREDAFPYKNDISERESEGGGNNVQVMRFYFDSTF